MAMLISLVAVVSEFGAPVLAEASFMFGGCLAAYWYSRKSPWDYVLLTFWFWTLTPLARRLVDYYAGFNATNPILATPNLLTLFMVRDILASRELPRRRETVVGLFLLMPVLYGFVLSLAEGDVGPGLVGSAEWIAPLLYYFYFIENWRRIGEAENAFRKFLATNGSVVVVYGLAQYVQPLPWDIAWLFNSKMINLGRPVPYGLHVFGTLNSSGPLALWLGTVLLLLLHFRTRISLPLALGCALLLLTTLVRSVTGTVVLCLLLAALLGRSAISKMVLVGLVGFVVIGTVVIAYNPQIVATIFSRFETFGSLDQDDSAITREEIYRSTPALINAHPFGLGIGALGRGAVVSQNSDLVTVDSGPLAIYLALGWVGGSVYLLGLTLVLLQALVAAKQSRQPAALILAVAAVEGGANLPFSTMGGLWSASVLSCASYAAALGIAGRAGRP